MHICASARTRACVHVCAYEKEPLMMLYLTYLFHSTGECFLKTEWYVPWFALRSVLTAVHNCVIHELETELEWCLRKLTFYTAYVECRLLLMCFIGRGKS